MTRRWAAMAVACLLAACHPNSADLVQLPRMLGEGAQARAAEDIRCLVRDRVCARLVQMRGEAAAQLANGDLPSAERARMRALALADARAMPGLLAADASQAEREQAALMMLDAWRSATGGDAPAPPDAVAAAVEQLDAIPGGGPYGAVLASYGATMQVLTGRAAAGTECRVLEQARRRLPDPASGELAERVAGLRGSIGSAQLQKGCA